MPACPPASPWRGGSHNQAAVHRAVAVLLGDQQGLDGELVERAGEVEALAVGAAQAGQLQGLGLVLDALGDHPQAEEVGDAQDGVGQGLLLGPAEQAVHERLGQLEDVNGQVAQVGQGRVAGAEVVEARWTPRARRPTRRSSLASWSVASTLSVISSISWSGSRPEASRAPATSSSRSGCWSWRTDRLTLGTGGAGGGSGAASRGPPGRRRAGPSGRWGRSGRCPRPGRRTR